MSPAPPSIIFRSSLSLMSFTSSLMMSNMSLFDDSACVCIAIHPESASLGLLVTMRWAVPKMSSKEAIVLLIFRRSSGVPYVFDAAFCIMRIADCTLPLLLLLEVRLSVLTPRRKAELYAAVFVMRVLISSVVILSA